jgi:hypothetical protein
MIEWACGRHGTEGNTFRVLQVNHKERYYLLSLGCAGNTVIKQTYTQLVLKVWAGFIWLRLGPSDVVL